LALDHGECASGGFREFMERLDAAAVLFDRDHPRAGFQQAARQAARAGADLDHHPFLDDAGSADDAPGQIEIEQKLLA
jgi:hypothetical protein